MKLVLYASAVPVVLLGILVAREKLFNAKVPGEKIFFFCKNPKISPHINFVIVQILILPPSPRRLSLPLLTRSPPISAAPSVSTCRMRATPTGASGDSRGTSQGGHRERGESGSHW